MRIFLLAYAYIAAGVLLWLGDAAFFIFIYDYTLPQALWSGIAPLRLLIRLIAEAVLFIVALKHLQSAADQTDKLNYWPQTPDEELWYGSPYSEDKGKRLLFFSLKLAIALRLNAHEQDKLRRLCYCYDLGLFNEAESSPGAHIELGAAIAAHFKSLQSIVPLIRAHEEYYNGSGYYCLAGQRIPIQCRILQVVLMFDDLHQGTARQAGLSYGAALEELSYYSGAMLDPELVELFQRLMRRMPMIRERTALTSFEL